MLKQYSFFISLSAVSDKLISNGCIPLIFLQLQQFRVWSRLGFMKRVAQITSFVLQREVFNQCKYSFFENLFSSKINAGIDGGLSKSKLRAGQK